MAKVHITADIDADRMQVTLSSDQENLPGPTPPDFKLPDTFSVVTGDQIEWNLAFKGDLGGRRAAVRFVVFPGGVPRPLLVEHPDNVLEALLAPGGTHVGGTVSKDALSGHYEYRVELVGAGAPDVLTCLWAARPGQPPQAVKPPMGGGEKRGG